MLLTFTPTFSFAMAGGLPLSAISFIFSLNFLVQKHTSDS
jgi:hypothetical protein